MHARRFRSSPANSLRVALALMLLFASLVVTPAAAAPPGSHTGRVSVEVKDLFAKGRATTRWLLETGSERLVIEGKGKERLRHGDRVRLRGTRSAGTLNSAAEGVDKRDRHGRKRRPVADHDAQGRCSSRELHDRCQSPLDGGGRSQRPFRHLRSRRILERGVERPDGDLGRRIRVLHPERLYLEL